MYPRADSSLPDLLPADTGRVLSLGTTSGQPEQLLAARGIHVTGIPADAVIGTVAERAGVDMLPPVLPEMGQAPPGGRYDALIALDVLGYLDDPADALARVRPWLREGATILATAHDHRRQSWRERLRPSRDRQDLPPKSGGSGLARTSSSSLRQLLVDAAFEHVRVRHRRSARRSDPVGAGGWRNRLAGNTLVATAVVPAANDGNLPSP